MEFTVKQVADMFCVNPEAVKPLSSFPTFSVTIMVTAQGRDV